MQRELFYKEPSAANGPEVSPCDTTVSMTTNASSLVQRPVARQATMQLPIKPAARVLVQHKANSHMQLMQQGSANNFKLVNLPALSSMQMGGKMVDQKQPLFGNLLNLPVMAPAQTTMDRPTASPGAQTVSDD